MSKATTKGKEIAGYICLCLPARKATPGPPIGPAFGQKGVSGAEFAKQFNEVTKKLEENTPVRVRVSVYTNRTFTFVLLGTPVSHYLKQSAKIAKGGSEAGRSVAGTITKSDLKAIAEIKMQEGLSARSIESAMKIIAGSARAMGLTIIEERSNG
ncbi:50S ribosomal protein L11 [Alphaproteobacteria bacterium endosymbiont of Tiliacea citrago]|uniref:50S ribosomal protein L11 n=1 Tax=Alphaproteobacteria bacterium endosymbiont of Tiliacea citrago TaxID=3077944 RepID=UPI00313BC95D